MPNDLLPPALNYLYTSNSDVHNYTTRQRNLLHVKKSNINTYSNSFGNTSARKWNVVQSKIEVRTLTSLKINKILYYVSCTCCLPQRINIEVNM